NRRLDNDGARRWNGWRYHLVDNRRHNRCGDTGLDRSSDYRKPHRSLTLVVVREHEDDDCMKKKSGARVGAGLFVSALLATRRTTRSSRERQLPSLLPLPIPER